MVGSWIEAGDSTTGPAVSAWWRRPWLLLGPLAVAAAVAFMVSSGDPKQLDETLVPKGGDDSAGLALQVLCGEPLRPADESGCRLDEQMSFAYRTSAAGDAAGLVLFGVDEHGDTLYYAPTPVDAALADVSPDQWRPVGLTVDLDVNHEAGRLTVYGLVTTNAATARDVDRFATTLAGLEPAAVGDAPWPQKIRSELLSSLCDTPTECPAAEFPLVLHEAER